MSGHVELWAWDSVTGIWRKVLVDAAGNLQVMEQGTPGVHLYGWDGLAWRNLLVESAALYNLRVKLYDGATAIGSDPLSGVVPSNKQGLDVNAVPRMNFGGNLQDVYCQLAAGDGYGPWINALHSIAFPMGWNGATWDKLRTDGLGVIKVSKGDIQPTVAHPAAAGAVVAGVHKIFWIACTPDAAGSEWELSDDTTGLTAEVYCHFDTDRHSEHIDFNPPLEFATGIYVKKFDKMKCLHICYI